MERAREIARRVQSGERTAMRRWLRERCSSWCKYLTTTDQLVEEIKKFGGDSDMIRAEGKDRVVKLIYMEVQR